MKYSLLILVCAISFAANIKAQQSIENTCAETKKLNINISKNKIYVFGEVSLPQTIKYEADKTTQLEAIAMSGGFPKKASIQKIYITQCSAEFSSVKDEIFIDLKEIRKGNKIHPILSGGEIIYVPRKSEANFNAPRPIPNFTPEPSGNLCF